MFAMLFNDKPANSLLYTREEGLIGSLNGVKFDYSFF